MDHSKFPQIFYQMDVTCVEEEISETDGEWNDADKDDESLLRIVWVMFVREENAYERMIVEYEKAVVRNYTPIWVRISINPVR